MMSKIKSAIKLGVIHPSLLYITLEIRRSRRTFLGYQQMLSLAENSKLVYKRVGKPLHIAEFGVGRGGSAMMLAWMISHYGGKLTLFDVFDRIPAPTDTDGIDAGMRYQDILNNEGVEYYGNVPDLLEEIKLDLSKVCDLRKINFIQGKYEDVLPGLTNVQFFDFVHIDCDWYESLRAVYAYLKDHLNPGAILQVDDYLYWPGAKKATDETDWLKGYSHKLVGDALVIDTKE